jgi:hypothetical protein
MLGLHCSHCRAAVGHALRLPRLLDRAKDDLGTAVRPLMFLVQPGVGVLMDTCVCIRSSQLCSLC